MWSMHDGAPTQFSIPAREFSTATYPDRWVGRGGLTYDLLESRT